jgi:hypothetical protein
MKRLLFLLREDVFFTGWKNALFAVLFATD